MRFGPYTNSIGGNVITNTDIIVRAIGEPAMDAAGNITGAIGLPVRVHLTADGTATNWLQNQNYFVTNNPGTPAYFNKGYVFQAPLDSNSNTVYSTTAPGILRNGPNYFLTILITNGVGSVTYNAVTNGLGYAPLAPTDTNGYIRLLQATNVTIGAVPTNFWSSSATLWISNLISFGTLNTNRYAAGTLLTSSTNSAGLVTFAANSQTNGFTSIVSSNAAMFVGTNLLTVTSNGLASQITSGGINASTATNINNAASGVISTNGAGLTYKFSSTGTNVIQGLAQTISDASSNSVLATAQTRINTSSNSVLANAQTAINTSSNSVLGNAQTAINTSSNSVIGNAQTAINTSSNSVLGNAQTRINSASNTLSAATALKANTNAPTIWTPLIVGGGATNLLSTNGISFDARMTNRMFLGKIPVFDTEGSGEFQTGSMLGNIFGTDGTAGGLTLSQRSSGNWAIDNTILMGTGGMTNRSGGDTAFHQSFILGQNLFWDNFDTGANGDGNFNSTFAMGKNLRFYSTNTTTEQNFDRTFMFGSNIVAISQGGAGPENDSFLIGIGVTQRTNLILQANYPNGYDLFGGAINGNGGGVSNTWSTNLTGGALTQVTNIANSITIVGSGLTNAFGTNLQTLLVSGQRVYVPTNFDIKGGSNFLFNAQATASNYLAIDIIAASNYLQGVTSTSNAWFQATKLDKTSGVANGLTSTNTALEGNVSFGRDGLTIGIEGSGTNYIAFTGAGSSIATNGAWLWITSLGVYSNWLTGMIITNNGSAWLQQITNNTLYSKSGTSPIGAYSAINGSLPAPTANYTAALLPQLIFSGYWSVSNQNQIQTNVYLAAVGTASTNSIATFNGFGTNTTLTNATMAWSGAPFINVANNGGTLNFQAMSAGLANTNTGSGYGSAILSGSTNKITASGSSVIAGGGWNVLSGGFNNYCFLGSGLSNTISGVDGAVIGGGFLNKNLSYYSSILGGFGNFIPQNIGPAVSLGGYFNTNAGVGSVILGGATNYAGGYYSIVAGRNARASNDNVFIWSDGTPVGSQTNAEVIIAATNGLIVLVGGITVTNLNPGASTATLGVTSSGQLTTNGVSGGGGSGTVTSVDASVPSGFAVSGNPITTSGTLAITRSGDANNLGLGQTNISILKVTNTANIGALLSAGGINATNGITNQGPQTVLGSQTNGSHLSVLGNQTNFALIYWKALAAASGKSNIVFFDSTGKAQTNDLATFIASLGGSGSQTPVLQDIDAGQFALTNLYKAFWFTNASGSQIWVGLQPDFIRSIPTLRATYDGDALAAQIQANYFIAQGNGVAGSGYIVATNAGVFSKMDSNSVTTGTLITANGTNSGNFSVTGNQTNFGKIYLSANNGFMGGNLLMTTNQSLPIQSTVATNQYADYTGENGLTNFNSTLDGKWWTNLVLHTHEGTTTNITAAFNGTLQTFTCTNGPSVGQDYFFHYAGANGSISYRFSGASYNNLHFDYQPKWLAGSNSVITNGVLSLTSYGGTNGTQIEAAMRENQ